MSLEQTFKDQMKDAMRSRDQKRLDVVRMIRSKIQEATTAKGFTGEVNDALYLEVVQRYVKQMRKALPDYEAQGERGAEMVTQLQWEVDFLEEFLPKKLNLDETRALVAAAVSELGATSKAQMGQVMGKVMGGDKDRLDPALVKQCVAEALS